MTEDIPGFNENWLRPGGFTPINASTVAALICEVVRLRGARSRFTVSLPEEIEKLVADLRQWVEGLRANYEMSLSDITMACGECITEDIEKAAAALQRMAWEVDKLREIIHLKNVEIDHLQSEIDKLETEVETYEAPQTPEEVKRIVASVEEFLNPSPLPEEIAGLVERGKRLSDVMTKGNIFEDVRDCLDALVAALLQQAREIKSWELTTERLKAELALFEGRCREQAREIERLKELTNYSPAIRQAMHKFDAGMKLRERVRELESERDDQVGEIERLRTLVACKDCMEYAHRVGDAIKEKTIEECASLFDLTEGWGQIAHSEVAKRIRALKQKPQAETE